MTHTSGGGEPVGVLREGGVGMRQHQIAQRGEVVRPEAWGPPGARPIREGLASPMPR